MGFFKKYLKKITKNKIKMEIPMEVPKSRADWKRAWEINRKAIMEIKIPNNKSIEEGEEFESEIKKYIVLFKQRHKLIQLWEYYCLENFI